MSSSSHDNEQAQDNSGFAGTLRNIQITDIIQMCCLAGASLCIRVRQDDRHGTIYIQEGEIVHAECGEQVGVQAFFAVLGWQQGQFDTLEAPVVKNPTIKEPCQFLLMEAARQADEMAEAREEMEAAPEALGEEHLRVLIVDDSPIMCKILTSMLAADPSIEVAGTAKNGEEALKMMKGLDPDLITMDVNMPVMDGSTALKHIMIGSPCPVLIMSNLLPSSYDTLLSFLNLGAVDFMSKPVKSSNILLQQQRIVDRIHKAAKANAKRFHLMRCPKLRPSDFMVVKENMPSQQLIIANSGVGGYLESTNLITSLPAVQNSCLLSLQSIPPPFAATLCAYLNLRSRFDIRPLGDQVRLNPGRCYIGTGGQGLRFGVADGQIDIRLTTPGAGGDEAANIDLVYTGAAEIFQNRLVIVLLSGAETSTLEGLRAVKEAGGVVIAPRPDACIMPVSLEPVVEAGMLDETFDPADMPDVLKRYCP